MGYNSTRHKKIIFLFYCAVISCILESIVEEILGLDSLSSVLSVIDELFVLGSCIYTWCICSCEIKYNKLLLLILLFCATGLLSSFFYKGINIVSFLGAFNTIKPLLLFWSFSLLTFKTSDINYLFKLFSLIFPIIIFFEFVDIVYPSFRSLVGFKYQISEERMGLRSIAGIMPRFTMATIMGVLYFYIYWFYKKCKIKACLSVPLILFALRVKDIFAFAISAVLVFNKKVRLRNLFGAIIICMLMFVSYIIYFPEHFMRYFSDDEGNQARTALNLTGIEIAKDYFPFGVGFGKFGSPISQQYESEVYYQYGINNVYGLSYEHNSAFMSDTFWPMLLGETGLIGTLIYIFILFTVFSPFVKKYIHNTIDLRVCLVVSLLIFNLISSIAKPTLTGPPNSLLLFGIAGLFYQHLKTDN